MQKKAWTKPALIVVAPSEPEKAILVFCKYVWPAGPQSAQTGCWNVADCEYCTAHSFS
mgnify:CR=1 FL=1